MKLTAKLSILCLLLIFTASCAHRQHGGGTPPPHTGPPIVGIDPTFTWSAVTKGCGGDTLTGVTYNVYMVALPATIPTVTVTTIPCGAVVKVDKTKISPINAAPISALTYNAMAGNGSYVAVIEANVTGIQGIASTPISFAVESAPNAPTSIQVAWDTPVCRESSLEFAGDHERVVPFCVNVEIPKNLKVR